MRSFVAVLITVTAAAAQPAAEFAQARENGKRFEQAVSQGIRPDHWTPGTRTGAVRDGSRLYLTLEAAGPMSMRFDLACHRRFLNFDRNYVRLNEFPNGTRWMRTPSTACGLQPSPRKNGFCSGRR